MLSCSSASSRLSALTDLRQALAEAIHKADSPALERAQQLKSQLEAGMQELSRELVLEITVADAVNPYAEGLREAGLRADHPECAEKKEVTFNLEELIQSHCDRYAAQGMTEWVEDIQTNQEQLHDFLTEPAEQDKIEKRIKGGLVPILMPSRAVQQSTWEKAFANIKPVWNKPGEGEQAIDDSYVYDKYPEKMTPPPNPDGTKPATFFDSLPDRPYLVWAKLTAEPASETTNLTFEEQKAKLAVLHSEKPDLVDALDFTPLEYAALQSIYTAEVKRQALASGLDSTAINSITPLDKAWYTRFLSAGLFSDGGVPFAYFYPDRSRLYFYRVGVGANSKRGFRPAARS